MSHETPPGHQHLKVTAPPGSRGLDRIELQVAEYGETVDPWITEYPDEWRWGYDPNVAFDSLRISYVDLVDVCPCLSPDGCPNRVSRRFGCTSECGCEGKVVGLTLRYLGATGGMVTVVQKKDGAAVFEGSVRPGEEFSFVGTDKKGTLGTEIKVYVEGVEHTKIHTSCSQPIGPGLVFGDFKVVSGWSREGGPLCPLGEDDPDSDSDSDKKKNSCSDADPCGCKETLPVAALGDVEFDVGDLVPETCTLAVRDLHVRDADEPVHRAVLDWKYGDVSTPDLERLVGPHSCVPAEPDGYEDLVLDFDLEAIAAALGGYQAGDVVVLELACDTWYGGPGSFRSEDIVELVD